MIPPALKRRMADCPAWRISPDDTNYMALVFDPSDAGCGLVAVVEIFEPRGRTPPNAHTVASEFFFVLRGEGRARIGDGDWTPLATGDALMVRAGQTHVVENTGDARLYCLTVMVPDEGFSHAIRAGTPVQLDEADRRVLAGTG
jgi:mannose-6-phosphate isomerase-like protein (cupin superfamily)